MEETTFAADPMRLMIAAAVGIIVLLVLIIKFKLHPVLSMMISAIIIGAGAGMPLTMISDTVEKGVGKTLQGIALLVGLGSMFGGILEVSGGAQRIAETLIHKFGQKKAGWALGLTGLVIGTTVFFEAGVVVLIPLAFSVAHRLPASTSCRILSSSNPHTWKPSTIYTTVNIPFTTAVFGGGFLGYLSDMA